MSCHGFKTFKHVLKLTDDATDGILNGTVYVMPKLDGSNGSVWSDGNDIYCGSRKREITVSDDNASFCQYITSTNDDNIVKLRDFCRANPNLIVYGEWLRGVNGAGFVGNIKAYKYGGFWVFAVYDNDTHKYIDYPTYSDMLVDAGFHNFIEPLAVFENPSIDDVDNLLDNHYNLPEHVFGEGVVIWNYGFVNKYGHFEVGKIVRAEFKANKSKPKNVVFDGDVENAIVQQFLSDEEVFKSRMKSETQFDMEFDKSVCKMVAFVMSDVWNSFLEDNIKQIVKKYGKYDIKFTRVNELVRQRVCAALGI